MSYHFTPAKPGRPTVLALHGRGGCERQLVGLLRAADRSLRRPSKHSYTPSAETDRR